MTDKPRDLGDWQSAVDAYVAAGYSKEGAEATIDQHCAIVASHKPPAPVPAAVAEPEPIVEEPEQDKESALLGQDGLEPIDSTDDAKEEEPV